MCKIRIDGQQQMFLQHTLDDVFRRTDHIKILMPLFNLRQHDLVDVECLVNDTDILTGLFFIICLEILEYTFADVICPVIDFKDPLTRFTGIIASGQGQ